MLEQQREAWKELVSCLPGVLNAEFVLDGDIVREIHVLADQSRYPKQIVRDIQSAMAARFQMELDHRIISVAQIPAPPTFLKRRLICRQLDLSTCRDSINASVTLELDGRQKRGESIACSSTYDRNRCIAQATVDAINGFLNTSNRFSLVEWKSIPMGERNITLAMLQLFGCGKPEYLIGACQEGDDPSLAAVYCTLDAVNRRILNLSLSPDNT